MTTSEALSVFVAAAAFLVSFVEAVYASRQTRGAANAIALQQQVAGINAILHQRFEIKRRESTDLISDPD